MQLLTDDLELFVIEHTLQVTGKEAKLVELGAQIVDLERSLAASNASAATVSVWPSLCAWNSRFVSHPSVGFLLV